MVKKNLRQPPPTYKAVTEWVKKNRGYTVKTCWIADIKEQMGYPMKKAPNRKGSDRVEPCPRSKVNEDIQKALERA
ncbi:MAG: hypothetical protein LBP20_11160 [Treponema sp.]|jgi:hypothetical protein|nr:hypothetical protein [Treponema sp.]